MTIYAIIIFILGTAAAFASRSVRGGRLAPKRGLELKNGSISKRVYSKALANALNALAVAFILSAMAAVLASSTAQRIGSFLLALLGVLTAFFVLAVTVRKKRRPAIAKSLFYKSNMRCKWYCMR
ncbi:MAG: hypothetical protein IKI64_01135 [Clostridia bacterium]|nr:hypothetical protein [Clostridia bacterium]